VNQNFACAGAATAWEGDILFRITPDAWAPSREGVELDLFDGSCRAATYVAEPAGSPSEFAYQGRRRDWARLFGHEIDPVTTILDGTFQIKGNRAKGLRFIRAEKEPVETGALVPSEP
jgi:putative sterol carrier protein